MYHSVLWASIGCGGRPLDVDDVTTREDTVLLLAQHPGLVVTAQ